jgi:glycine C-acetyltransferase
MYGQMKQDLLKTLEELKEQGLYKTERIISSCTGF